MRTGQSEIKCHTRGLEETQVTSEYETHLSLNDIHCISWFIITELWIFICLSGSIVGWMK